MARCRGGTRFHNGQPIVLMNDAQTTGGYPRIACIIDADMYQLAQIRWANRFILFRARWKRRESTRGSAALIWKQLAWRFER